VVEVINEKHYNVIDAIKKEIHIRVSISKHICE
jgi:hypothetical protein